MPRKAREKSRSGIYHVIIRGANRQEIFHDEEDSRRFLETLLKYKKVSGLKIYGWCLMSNHVHLLLKEGNEGIDVTMKRLGVSFVFYYNWKYLTTGHLFQDRFRSEKVETEKYLLTVARYIHQNPLKAGLVKKVNDWKWSSCSGYYGGTYYPSDLLDHTYILKLFSDDLRVARDRFKEFNEKKNDDKCLEDSTKIKRLSDDEARVKIKKILGDIEIAQVKILQGTKRTEILREVKKINGVSQRQAARILGVSPNLIFKA
ncbi:REP element-mobilizing transposase RayT [Evansella vedderi]|uniref:REP element-mobilizing transposase RayT n=1 Tax=Evansella vedderi TaxID=38282 RepID=A0ABT9ZTB4_9BACI|nr:transposase [Evansella vedderi]MDQ0254478.1 REP element-mobilizing transposase RayT [Evansella vedderi]